MMDSVSRGSNIRSTNAFMTVDLPEMCVVCSIMLVKMIYLRINLLTHMRINRCFI